MFEYTESKSSWEWVEGLAVYWPRSESFGPDNLFYAFNLGGLVTYIPSSHLFETSLLWVDIVHHHSLPFHSTQKIISDVAPAYAKYIKSL